MPSDFEEVNWIAEGANGRVQLAIPKADFEAAQTLYREGDDQEAIETALSKVVAIKYSNDLTYEIDVLEKIRQHTTPENGGEQIVQIGKYDEGGCTWFAMSTMAVSCSIKQLMENNQDPLTPALTWLVAKSLYEAIKYLRYCLDPRIHHFDIDEANVIIGLQGASRHDLPAVKLIDFGEARFGEEGDVMDMNQKNDRKTNEVDNASVYEIIVGMAKACKNHRNNTSGSTGCGGLDKLLADYASAKKFDPTLPFFWKKYGKYADAAIAELENDDKKMEAACGIVSRAAMHSRGDVEDSMRELFQQHASYDT